MGKKRVRVGPAGTRHTNPVTGVETSAALANYNVTGQHELFGRRTLSGAASGEAEGGDAAAGRRVVWARASPPPALRPRNLGLESRPFDVEPPCFLDACLVCTARNGQANRLLASALTSPAK